MKKILCLVLILFCANVFATSKVLGKIPRFAPVNWTSNNPSDIITINNGTGEPVVIFIQVQATDTMGNPVNGIEIKNCGKTTHVNPGSSAVCYNSDEDNPVSFNSDGKHTDKVAWGFYQVEP